MTLLHQPACASKVAISMFKAILIFLATACLIDKKAQVAFPDLLPRFPESSCVTTENLPAPSQPILQTYFIPDRPPEGFRADYEKLLKQAGWSKLTMSAKPMHHGAMLYLNAEHERGYKVKLMLHDAAGHGGGSLNGTIAVVAVQKIE